MIITIRSKQINGSQLFGCITKKHKTITCYVLIIIMNLLPGHEGTCLYTVYVRMYVYTYFINKPTPPSDAAVTACVWTCTRRHSLRRRSEQFSRPLAWGTRRQQTPWQLQLQAQSQWKRWRWSDESKFDSRHPCFPMLPSLVLAATGIQPGKLDSVSSRNVLTPAKEALSTSAEFFLSLGSPNPMACTSPVRFW